MSSEYRFNQVLAVYDKYDKEYNEAFDNLQHELEACNFDMVIVYAEKCKHLRGYKMLLKFKLEIMEPERAKQISY